MGERRKVGEVQRKLAHFKYNDTKRYKNIITTVVCLLVFIFIKTFVGTLRPKPVTSHLQEIASQQHVVLIHRHGHGSSSIIRSE